MGGLKGKLSDEEDWIQRGTDPFALRRAEMGTPVGGGDPEDGHLQADDVSLEETVWADERG
jgi:hypothetical protein